VGIQEQKTLLEPLMQAISYGAPNKTISWRTLSLFGLS